MDESPGNDEVAGSHAKGTAERAIDRPAARIGAVGVALLCAAALLAIHWDDLFPPKPVATAADDPVQKCIAERSEDIQRMFDEGLIGEDKATLFRNRAAALCEATEGGGNSGAPTGPRLPE
ncbi:MAG: hypothetical protein R3316_11175 [Rhodovibrionaceae bacterium]|nr:hypothetical protein [Rhodovibrionaceae bacterium]